MRARYPPWPRHDAGGNLPVISDPAAYPLMVGSRTVPGDQSPEFTQALSDLRGARLRPEIRLTEVPAPQRIAPYAVALTAEVVGAAADEDELASGRFVLLHDPSVPDPWDGAWRAVTFARAELEPELANDPMLGAVGLVLADRRPGVATTSATPPRRARSPAWSPRASPGCPTGRPASRWRSAPRGPRWPATSAPTCVAWSDLLCTIAGLPPLPEGVIALPGPRR